MRCSSLKPRSRLALTDLLSELPADACIKRNLDSLSEAVNGPDGRPLTTRGTVTIIFAINGRVFEHEFLVVEGAPLLILGNDFHVAHAARITFPDGQREGTLELTSSINEELPTTHVVSVTCGPTGQAAVVAVGKVTSLVYPRRYKTDKRPDISGNWGALNEVYLSEQGGDASVMLRDKHVMWEMVARHDAHSWDSSPEASDDDGDYAPESPETLSKPY